jgi:hypothetical protein
LPCSSPFSAAKLLLRQRISSQEIAAVKRPSRPLTDCWTPLGSGRWVGTRVRLACAHDQTSVSDDSEASGPPLRRRASEEPLTHRDLTPGRRILDAQRQVMHPSNGRNQGEAETVARGVTALFRSVEATQHRLSF